MGSSKKLTILMPCLNEAETITTCITKAREFITIHNIDGEILIADNGSTDGSVELAREAGARVIQVSDRGYGNALLGGLNAANGKYIIMGDADDSYDFSNLAEFIQALDDGFDLVMGNRFKGGIRPKAMPGLHRYIGNPILSWIGRLFFESAIGDYHCGLRAFRKDAIRKLELQTTGMEFASEMVVKASLKGLRITEVPTVLYPDGRSRPSHLQTWSDGWRHLRFLLIYSPRWLFLYPGLLLMVLGFLISVWLLPGPRKIGEIILDINTLLFGSFFVLLGLQAVLFYIYSRVFSSSVGFLPQEEEDNFQKMLSLERGIMLGFSMMILGILSSIGAIIYWSRNQFGPIDPTLSLRWAIPGVVMFAMGIQILFSSFFISILQTKRKK
jgi:glycosyltransferase involved in cell wall biosynthesis